MALADACGLSPLWSDQVRAKRYLVAFGAGGLVFARCVRSSGGAAQAGSDDTLQCTDSVEVRAYEIDAEPPVSNGVEIGGIGMDSDGRELFATVSGAGGQLARGSAIVVGGIADITWRNGATPNVEEIIKLDVAID